MENFPLELWLKNSCTVWFSKVNFKWEREYQLKQKRPFEDYWDVMFESVLRHSKCWAEFGYDPKPDNCDDMNNWNCINLLWLFSSIECFLPREIHSSGRSALFRLFSWFCLQYFLSNILDIHDCECFPHACAVFRKEFIEGKLIIFGFNLILMMSLDAKPFDCLVEYTIHFLFYLVNLRITLLMFYSLILLFTHY